MTTNRNNSIDIFDALWKNKIKTVKAYIKNGGDVNVKNRYGNTPLMLAKDVEIAKLLMDAGADVNIKNQDGSAALMSACYAPNVKIARLLLNAGADVNAKNNWGETALTRARNTKIVQLLKSHGAVA